MNCKDCIHYDACESFAESLKFATEKFLNRQFNPKFPYENIECRAFKPKSRYIELPCVAGDKFWLLNLNEEQNRILEIDPICEAVVDRIEILRDNVERFILLLPTKHLCMKIRGVENFGKTVFLTKEEAEKALKEKQQ